MWLCKCDCGKEVEFEKVQLYMHKVKSCGCQRDEVRKVSMKRAMDKLRKVDLVDGTSINKISDTYLPMNNTSGHKGVSFKNSTQRWVARITFKRKVYFLGSYEKIEDAIKVRKEAEKKFFKPVIENVSKKH